MAETIISMRQFAAYAGPHIWGPWVDVASHLGRATFTITASAVGETVLRSRVRYFPDDGERVAEFGDSTTVTTGNTVANVSVSFMGVPIGSAVAGTITP
jgi:hypothetical protein